jgi:cell division protein FtsB
MLNWRRDPVVEMQIVLSEQRTKQLKSEIEQLEKEIEQLKRDNALLDWMHSELDLIEADLPSSSTPPPTIAANFSDC